jgi:hypothetical protein
VDDSRPLVIHLHNGCGQEIRRIKERRILKEFFIMSTMQIGFGILFLIGGLALAVLLGIALYREPEKKTSRTATETAAASKGA